MSNCNCGTSPCGHQLAEVENPCDNGIELVDLDTVIELLSSHYFVVQDKNTRKTENVTFTALVSAVQIAITVANNPEIIEVDNESTKVIALTNDMKDKFGVKPSIWFINSATKKYTLMSVEVDDIDNISTLTVDFGVAVSGYIMIGK